MGSKEERKMKTPVFLIDNGHGRETPGKRSPNGKLMEWSWTREVAARIVDGLKEEGETAFLLTPENEDIPLSKRVARVQAYCRQYGSANVILVSVHCNAAGNGQNWTSAHGWCAYTTPGTTRADGVAKCLYARADECFDGRKIRRYANHDNPDFEAQFYILQHTTCPAVLTENFFMDNLDDCAYLLTEEGKTAVVRCHVTGLIDYVGR